MRDLLVLIVGILFHLSATSQSLTGYVFAESDGSPLIGANVTSGSVGTTTDINGQFFIELDDGTHKLSFTYIGFATQEIDVVISSIPPEAIIIQLIESGTTLSTATITGSKYERNLSEAISSIAVIKPNLIENTNVPSIDDVLDKVPGVQMIDGQASIRGGSGYAYGAGSRVLLLIDDIPALQADAGRANWNDVPIENISQVEVLKGASSVLYGSSAMNGIINIRTGYATSKPVTKASVSYTQYDDPDEIKNKWWDDSNIPNNYNASILHKRKIKDLDLVIGGFYNQFASYYQDAYEDRWRTNLKLRYRVSDVFFIGVNSVYNKSKSANAFLWRNPIGGGLKAVQVTESDATRFYIDPFCQFQDKTGNQHKITSRYYTINNKNNNDQSNQSTYSNIEYQFQHYFKRLEAELVAGAVGSLIRSDSELFGDTSFTGSNFAVYGQLNKTFFNKLNVTIGGRLENNRLKSPAELYGQIVPNEGKNVESKFIGRAGLNYPLTKSTFIRSSWGQGYRYPTITEKFISTTAAGFTIFPNLELESEEGWTTEVGVKQGLKIGQWQGYIDLALFWSQYTNMTEFGFYSENQTLGFRSKNVGDTDIKGAELEFITNATFGKFRTDIMAGYTLINPKYRNFANNPDLVASSSSTENVLKYRNRHNLTIDAQIAYRFFNLGLSFKRVSAVTAIDNLFYEPVDFVFIGAYLANNDTAYKLIDARIGFKFKHFNLSFLVNNAMNLTFTKRPGIFEAPRNVSAKLSFNF